MGDLKRRVLVTPPRAGNRFLRLVYVTGQPGGKGKVHTHPGEEAIFTIQGKAAITIDGERFVLEANTAFIVPPGKEHPLEIVGDVPWIAVSLVLRRLPADEGIARLADIARAGCGAQLSASPARTAHMIRYRVRSVGLASAAKFGVALGVLASLLPACLTGLLAVRGVSALRRLLEGATQARLTVLGQNMQLNLVEIARLGPDARVTPAAGWPGLGAGRHRRPRVSGHGLGDHRLHGSAGGRRLQCLGRPLGRPCAGTGGRERTAAHRRAGETPRGGQS